MPSNRQYKDECWHVAIIMDGNSRWAKARALPREAGNHAGVTVLREATQVAALRGIYAFSAATGAPRRRRFQR